MKVKLAKEYRRYYTLDDLARAKTVISQMKDDEWSPKEYAEMAVREALAKTEDFLIEVIKADAHTARNARAWNAYSNDSEDMDVLINATAETYYGFIVITAYLTDIWQTGAKSYRGHMYVRYYTRCELP